MNYELTGAKWGSPVLGTEAGPVTYSFVTQTYGNEPIHLRAQPLAPEYQAEVREAFSEWSQTAGISFAEVADSPASQIRIGWEPMDGPYYTVGQSYWTYQGGQLQQSWIGFDNGENWLPGPSGPELGNGLDFEAVALHEIGHSIGLGHYDAEPAIMNPIITAETLQPSDMAGVQALYGAPIAPALVASAATAPSPVGTESHLAMTLPEGGDLDAALQAVVAAAGRPGFDDALAGALGLGQDALDGLGKTIVTAAADPDGGGLEHAAQAIHAQFPQLEAALTAHWPGADHWFA